MAKSKWDEIKQKLADVEIWASLGLSERQIAKNLGISKSTFDVNDNITMNREWKIKMYKNDH